jgi:hypothetical protein
MDTSEGRGPLIGVPPGASVILAPATMTVVVIVGIMIMTVVVDFTKVSETAPEGGAGFGSGQINERLEIHVKQLHLLQSTSV